MATQKTVVLNSFGLVRRERTTTTNIRVGDLSLEGNVTTGIRYSVSIDAQPMIHTFDAKTLGMGPAEAMAEHLRKRVATIGVRAAATTILKRKYAADALDRGESWAQARYSGGRTGQKRPGASDRLFNDSGRLAEGIVATPTRDNQYVVNVPANRFDPRTFRDGEAGIMRMFVKLRELVPEFGDASQLATVPAIRQAIGESLDYIFVSKLGRSYGGSSDLRSRVRASQMDALRQALELVSELGDI